MAIRDVLIYPDVKLKIEAKAVEDITHEIRDVIQDLKDTMLSTTHSVGIAATQIGANLRIITVDASRNAKCATNHGELTLINPEILKHEGVVTFREGCMSVPDYTGNVNRADKIMVSFYDEEFKQKVLEFEGFESILVQHETDHLDGILFIDRVISKRTDIFKRKKY